MKKPSYIFPFFFSLFFLTLFFVGCSSKSDKKYFELGNKDIAAKQYDKAAQSYQALVEKHPESKLAPEALFKLASLYHENMIKNMPHDESLNKAVEYYGEVFEKYPNSSKASIALFIKGFILANELNDYSEAKQAYTLFLKKYPNNQLIPSVKEELDNLGVPPEQILKGKAIKPT
jgi:outer membrane protein assembly factor BamD (BamD/ComL family)